MMKKKDIMESLQDCKDQIEKAKENIDFQSIFINDAISGVEA